MYPFMRRAQQANRAAMARASRAPQPMTRGPGRMPMRRWGFRGAEELAGADSKIMFYGIVPMAAAVAAGLWMALH